MNPEGTATPAEGPHDPWLEARVTRLEDDMGEIRSSLRRLEPMIIRMDATMPHLATRSELQELRVELKNDIATLRHDLSGEVATLRRDLSGEVATSRRDLSGEVATLRHDISTGLADVKIALADKPSRLYMSGIITAMVAAFACGLAGLAVVK